MERAILFFDIDGTVLSEVTKEVPQSAIEAMEKARAEGHLLFINTGRTICSIPTEVRKFQPAGIGQRHRAVIQQRPIAVVSGARHDQRMPVGPIRCHAVLRPFVSAAGGLRRSAPHQR